MDFCKSLPLYSTKNCDGRPEDAMRGSLCVQRKIPFQNAKRLNVVEEDEIADEIFF